MNDPSSGRRVLLLALIGAYLVGPFWLLQLRQAQYEIHWPLTYDTFWARLSVNLLVFLSLAFVGSVNFAVFEFLYGQLFYVPEMLYEHDARSRYSWITHFFFGLI